MKMAIMQPYPFPYIGYFQLMAQVDRWVVLDIVQYTRRSWMNRNRILHPDEGWQYFTLPVHKMPIESSLRRIHIADPDEAKRRLLAQLQHYQRHAPYFASVVDMVRDAFSRVKTSQLVDFNVASLEAVAERLGIATLLEHSSKIAELDTAERSGQIVLEIAKRLSADIYINPPGGQDIYDPKDWAAAGIQLAFSEMNNLRYDCAPYRFEPNLSVLDVLMWNSTDAIRAWIDDHRTKGIIHAH